MRSKSLLWPFVVTLVAGASCASLASAATVVYDGYSWYGSDISITSPNSISGGAGQIQLYTPYKTTIDAWCVDIFTYLGSSGAFQTGPLINDSSTLPGGPNLLSTAQIGEIGALALNGDDLLRSPGATDDKSAAIQIAIWSIEYGSGFAYTGVDNNIPNLVSEYIGNVTGASPLWKPYSNFATLTEAGNQNLITTSVPEPATWAMMLLGFAGLGFAGHRRARKSHAAFVVA